MDNKDNNKKEQKKFYIALYSTVAIIAATALLVSVGNKNTIEEKQLALDETAGGAAIEPVNKLNVKSYKEMTSEYTTFQITTTSTTTQKQLKKESVTEVTTLSSDKYTLFDEGKEMLWPVDGKILMDYSIETAVYDKTLDQYRTNDSICISAHIGDSVLVSADGVIEQIIKDEENGNKVTINHGNGWLSTYSQLNDNITVKEGQVVHQGDILGCVGQPSKYNTALGANLEFTVSKDNEPMDPKLLLMQTEE